ncbi:MAG: hypothetical protein U9Q76_07850 [candidate division WOR-3 bacterium]|nr:hypothetical protein [candidate division WOR-3 bacterium]
MNLQWIKCGFPNKPEYWCQLLFFNIDHENLDNFEGVYVIWHGGEEPIRQRIVRVGQGKIRERLKEHKEDEEILAFKPKGLYVTWAAVDGRSRDGVERYLGDTLNPKTPKKDKRFPDATPIRVNLPW